MTRDDIIRIAHETGFNPMTFMNENFELFEHFAFLVAEAERKRLTDAEQKCVVLNCTNHKSEGKFQGDLCTPCYVFVSTGKGVYSQAYRNTQRQPLTVEELKDKWNAQADQMNQWSELGIDEIVAFAQAAHGIGEKE